jgi:hypothetical protein
MKRSGKGSRKLHPALKKMSGIVKQLSKQGVRKDLFKKASRVYHKGKKSMPRMKNCMSMKSAVGGRLMW